MRRSALLRLQLALLMSDIFSSCMEMAKNNKLETHLSTVQSTTTPPPQQETYCIQQWNYSKLCEGWCCGSWQQRGSEIHQSDLGFFFFFGPWNVHNQLLHQPIWETPNFTFLLHLCHILWHFTVTVNYDSWLIIVFFQESTLRHKEMSFWDLDSSVNNVQSTGDTLK